MNRLDPLDAMRVLAMIIVFTAHIIDGGPVYHFAGGVGVWIFFILSGYQIGKGFKAGRYEDTKAYLKKRFLAIAVPYLLAVPIIIALNDISAFWTNPVDVIRLMTFTTYRSHLGYLWFVTAIMHLYILAIPFAYVVRKCSVNMCRLIFISLAVACLIIRIVNIHNNYYMINFDAFFCAFLISYVGINKEAITTVHRRIVLASFIVMMIAFLYLTRRPYVWVYGETTVLIVVIAMVVCFDFEVRKHNERLTKDAIRRNPWRILEAFGATSLAFYIWHYFIIWNMRTFTNAVAKAPDYGAYVPVFISAFVLTCITATVWHLAVERPISRWGK